MLRHIVNKDELGISFICLIFLVFDIQNTTNKAILYQFFTSKDFSTIYETTYDISMMIPKPKYIMSFDGNRRRMHAYKPTMQPVIWDLNAFEGNTPTGYFADLGAPQR